MKEYKLVTLILLPACKRDGATDGLLEGTFYTRATFIGHIHFLSKQGWALSGDMVSIVESEYSAPFILQMMEREQSGLKGVTEIPHLTPNCSFTPGDIAATLDNIDTIVDYLSGNTEWASWFSEIELRLRRTTEKIRLRAL